jgi:hypothetical protein
LTEVETGQVISLTPPESIAWRDRFWSYPGGRISAGHLWPIGHQRTCRPNKTSALPVSIPRQSRGL